MDKNNKANKLAKQANLSIEVASAFLSGLHEVSLVGGGGQLEALKFRKKPGATSRKIISQNWQNILLDWKTALVTTVATLTSLGYAANRDPILGIVAALQAYRTIIGLFEVEITGELAKLVELVWFQFGNLEVIPVQVIKAHASEVGVGVLSLDSNLRELCTLGLIEIKELDGSQCVVRTDEIVAYA